MLLGRLPGETGRFVGDAAKNSQQRQFVRGRLVVVQDDAADQRQGTRSVIRQPDGYLPPVEPPPAKKVDIRTDPLDVGTVAARQLFDFLNGNRVHAAIRFQWTLTQCQRDDTSRLEQGDELAKRPFPERRGNEHPNRVHQDEIERQTGSECLRQFGQTIRYQLETYFRVPSAHLLAHDPVRLCGEYIVAQGCQPRRVPTAARSHIKYGSRLGRQKVVQPLVDARSVDGLVASRCFSNHQLAATTAIIVVRRHDPPAPNL